MIWHYMNKEGRPKQKGVYWVTLIFNGWEKEKQEPNNEKFAMIDTGSMLNERVWAWAEIEFNDFEETPFPDILPAGVKKWENQDE